MQYSAKLQETAIFISTFEELDTKCVHYYLKLQGAPLIVPMNAVAV